MNKRNKKLGILRQYFNRKLYRSKRGASNAFSRAIDTVDLDTPVVFAVGQMSEKLFYLIIPNEKRKLNLDVPAKIL